MLNLTVSQPNCRPVEVRVESNFLGKTHEEVNFLAVFSNSGSARLDCRAVISGWVNVLKKSR